MSVSEEVTVELEEFPKMMQQVISLWSKAYAEQTVQSIRKLSKKTKDVVKEHAPVDQFGRFPHRIGKYKKNISYKMLSTDIFHPQGIVYGKNREYTLTHLLENGHKLWQSPGKRTRAFKHWANGENYLENDGVRDMAKDLERVGK